MTNNGTLLLMPNGAVVESAGRTSGVMGNQNSPFLVFRLSWVAYLREVGAFFVRLILCGIAFMLLGKGVEGLGYARDASWVTVVGVALAVAWTVHSVLLTRSVRLFTDEDGVWVQSGVLPWEKGVTGVQWRDIGQAGYSQGILNWALRSYSVQITHRFTTGMELSLANVHRGNLAVEHINGVMAQLQGRIVLPG